MAELPEVHRPRNRPQWVGGLVLAGLLLLVLTDGSYRFGVVTTMIVTIITLSLVVLTGLVGQISLAQAAFAGSAGFVVAKLGDKLPFPLAMLVGGLAAAGLGVLIGIPALRIRGAQLAVVTLAGAIAIEKFVFRNPKLVGSNGDRSPIQSCSGSTSRCEPGRDITRLSFCVFVLIVLTLAALGVANIARGDTGRAFLAVRSNERAAAAAGISVSATKLSRSASPRSSPASAERSSATAAASSPPTRSRCWWACPSWRSPTSAGSPASAVRSSPGPSPRSASATSSSTATSASASTTS